jgi:hypothetical protein
VIGPARLISTEVASRGDTNSAFDISGDGPPPILIAERLSDRAPYARRVELPAPEFTVFGYHRRGRGASGDTPPYAVVHEIEDIDAADGPVHLYGSSSVANLALQAALSSPEITGLALWERNFIVDRSRPAPPGDYVEHLNEPVCAGCRGAVRVLHDHGGRPSVRARSGHAGRAVLTGARGIGTALAYDGARVEDTVSGKPLTLDPWASVTAPTLNLGGGTVPWMSAAPTRPRTSCRMPNGARSKSRSTTSRQRRRTR